MTPQQHAESSDFSPDDEATFVRMQDELRAYNDPSAPPGQPPPPWTKDEAVFLRFRAWQAVNLREKTRQVVAYLEAMR